ncbi:MAG: ribonuclease Z [Actinobacteria bacterium]|nr:ribonuclease Z [Actinomycetota bacterium]
MDLDVVFLGTSASAPTARRNPSALLIRRGGERLLFDCGEGTQRQLLRSTVGLVDLEEIFLTHFHADHFLGLPGMLKTFALRAREVPLTIYGPPGLRALYDSMRVVFGRLPYPVELTEIHAGDSLQRDGYRLLAFPVDHGQNALGYALVEDDRPGRFDVELADTLGIPFGPARGLLQRGEAITLDDGTVVSPDAVLGEARSGRRVVYTGDTAPSTIVETMATGADLLIHEATFTREESERARDTEHSTAYDAATLAQNAGVGLLALTHISTRYFGSEIATEATAVFPNTVVPRDFDIIEVPFAERGEPTLIRLGARPERESPAGTGASQ